MRLIENRLTALLSAMLLAVAPTYGGAAAAEICGACAPGLDRIAGAVDGVESSHGADPRMWRADPGGPEGPMQVSAAAASDVGGGDRFDIAANRALGRAYLAQMYRRFGSWPDALAAYNWGPGRLGSWIADGRPPEKMPFIVAWYRHRVLSAAASPYASFGLTQRGAAGRRLGIVHAQPRAAHRPGRGDAGVERLYALIIRASISGAR